MARAKGDERDVRVGARTSRDDLHARFENAWWMTTGRSTPTRSATRTTSRSQQKHWIGVTPMEAELTIDGQAVPGPGDVRPRHHARSPCARPTATAATRPYNLGLFHTGCGGGPTGAGRADDLLAQHRDPVRRRGQLRPARRRAAEALHGRQGRADVRRAVHGRHARRAAGRDAGDPAVAGLRRRRPERREHRPLLDLPRDVHAGVGQLRHGVAGRAPAARRAAGPRAAAA